MARGAPHAAQAERSACSGAGRCGVIQPRTLDVSGLAPGAFGHRSILWWGTMGIMLIEGMAFAITIGAYFYLRTRAVHWPPPHVLPPDLRWGTINTVILLASGIPNQLAKKAAERVDLSKVRLWLVVCRLFGIAF